MTEFWFKCHWNLFPGVQLTISQHWSRKWLGAKQATGYYLNQWWPRTWMHVWGTRGRWVNYIDNQTKELWNWYQNHNKTICNLQVYFNGTGAIAILPLKETLKWMNNGIKWTHQELIVEQSKTKQNTTKMCACFKMYILYYGGVIFTSWHQAGHTGKCQQWSFHIKIPYFCLGNSWY